MCMSIACDPDVQITALICLYTQVGIHIVRTSLVHITDARITTGNDEHTRTQHVYAVFTCVAAGDQEMKLTHRRLVNVLV